tara:strand:- start:455 stop:844 length:390 start_codon:yes stop_codon:yes gene_type:complete
MKNEECKLYTTIISCTQTPKDNQELLLSNLENTLYNTYLDCGKRGEANGWWFVGVWDECESEYEVCIAYLSEYLDDKSIFIVKMNGFTSTDPYSYYSGNNGKLVFYKEANISINIDLDLFGVNVSKRKG